MPESILTKGINEGEEYPAEPATEPILQFGVEFPIFYDYIDIDFDGVNLGDEIEREQERVRNYVRHIMKNRGIDSTLLKNKDDKRLFQYDSLSIKNLILDQSNEGCKYSRSQICVVVNRSKTALKYPPKYGTWTRTGRHGATNSTKYSMHCLLQSIRK